ncbi:MAG TPA: hydroxysqualene dehydroxylase HpnE [Ideonella sp.]|nr:hydroxysqualene dehydroxylase HpnE [Ideonella sp.]
MARLAVIGAGWAGLAAAVRGCELGHAVTLYEMSHHAGGRARTLPHEGLPLDNGQHILIGAYRDTLALMRQVGVDPDQVLRRLPLTLAYPDGSGLRLPAGRAVPSFLRGVLAWRSVPLAERLGLLALAAQWRLQGFRCAPGATVAELARRCPPTVYRDLLEPLCVAALNTPASQASGQVLLTVLRDALFGPPGSSDLLLPAAPLDELMPAAALRWLAAQGATLRLGQRVQAVAASGTGWQVDGEPHDQLVLAATAQESARLLAPHAPAWAAQAGAFEYQPIVTVWLQAPGARWPQPMMALRASDEAPAQFGFDLGALGGPADTYALVVSGAASWVARGLETTADAVEAQLRQAFGEHGAWPATVTRLAVRAEKRATFACVPGLLRPSAAPLAGLRVAGDFVDGPYPATLEGAVRSGLAAVLSLRA